eukprot:COSAG01_NODE_61063_length_288_cov_0.968750_1_plen_54_part_10
MARGRGKGEVSVLSARYYAGVALGLRSGASPAVRSPFLAVTDTEHGAELAPNGG